MKFTKSLFAVAVATIFSLANMPSASAQTAGSYSLLSGGTTRILAMTTNSIALGVVSTNNYNAPLINIGSNTNLLTQSVAEYNDVGITFGSGAGSNCVLQVFESMDNGATFGAAPAFSYATSASASAAYLTNVDIDVHGVGTLGFVIQNKGTLDLTNAYLNVNLKTPKMLILQARQ